MSDTLTHARSEQLFAEARRRIPGGVNSPVRAFSSVGGAPVFYSLGNFCYGGHSSPEDYDTAIVQLTVTGGGDGFAVTGVDVLPCSVSSSAGYNDFRPRLYTGEGDIARVLEKLRFTPAA